MTTETWDCHVHVFGPPARYPLAPDRRYTPAEAGPDQLRAHLQSVGATRVVLVQPTVYGADHACLLDALDTLGDAAVAVAAWTGAKPPPDPRILGLRLDLRGPWTQDHARTLDRASDAAAGRHLELQISPEALAPLAGMTLATPIVLDHLAGAPDDAAALARLLALPDVFVKLSALDRAPATALPLARQLAGIAPDRLLWGSDWPHTPLHPPAGARATPLPFRTVDDPAALRALDAALGPAARLARTDVPARFYGRRRF